jgi:hypothetical protein
MAFAERFLTTPDRVDVAGRQVKRYHINIDDTEIDQAVQDAAYAMLPRLMPPPDETPPASFSVLHRSAMGAYLLVYSWTFADVLDCRTTVAGVPALDCPDEDPTHFIVSTRHWIGCVWELAPLEHERSAWVRHILQPDRPDLAGYLADQHAPGGIGGPTAITEISGQVLWPTATRLR